MKKWIVDGVEFTTIDAVINYLRDYIDSNEFDDHIIDEHGTYTYLDICDGEWETIEILRRLDVYDDMLDEWIEDEKIPELRREVERMDIGDEVELCDCEIKCVDDIDGLFKSAREALNNIRTAFDALRPIYGGGQANNLNILIEFIDTVEEKVKKEA